MPERSLLPLHAETKLGPLLQAHPALEEALVRLSPEYRRLKNPVLRATVAKIATLGQVALVGGLAVDDLIAALHAAIAHEVRPGAGGAAAAAVGSSPGATNGSVGEKIPGDCPEASSAGGTSVLGVSAPSWFDRAKVAHTLDARAAIAEGRHPLPEVVGAAEALPAGSILELITPFEPAPLVDVLRGKGFEAWGERLLAGEVRTYFTRG